MADDGQGGMQSPVDRAATAMMTIIEKLDTTLGTPESFAAVEDRDAWRPTWLVRKLIGQRDRPLLALADVGACCMHTADCPLDPMLVREKLAECIKLDEPTAITEILCQMRDLNHVLSAQQLEGLHLKEATDATEPAVVDLLFWPSSAGGSWMDNFRMWREIFSSKWATQESSLTTWSVWFTTMLLAAEAIKRGDPDAPELAASQPLSPASKGRLRVALRSFRNMHVCIKRCLGAAKPEVFSGNWLWNVPIRFIDEEACLAVSTADREVATESYEWLELLIQAVFGCLAGQAEAIVVETCIETGRDLAAFSTLDTDREFLAAADRAFYKYAGLQPGTAQGNAAHRQHWFNSGSFVITTVQPLNAEYFPGFRSTTTLDSNPFQQWVEGGNVTVTLHVGLDSKTAVGVVERLVGSALEHLRPGTAIEEFFQQAQRYLSSRHGLEKERSHSCATYRRNSSRLMGAAEQLVEDSASVGPSAEALAHCIKTYCDLGPTGSLTVSSMAGTPAVWMDRDEAMKATVLDLSKKVLQKVRADADDQAISLADVSVILTNTVVDPGAPLSTFWPEGASGPRFQYLISECPAERMPRILLRRGSALDSSEIQSQYSLSQVGTWTVWQLKRDIGKDLGVPASELELKVGLPGSVHLPADDDARVEDLLLPGHDTVDLSFQQKVRLRGLKMRDDKGRMGIDRLSWIPPLVHDSQQLPV